MGSSGLLWVRLGEVKILWVRIMGVTLVGKFDLDSPSGYHKLMFALLITATLL